MAKAIPVAVLGFATLLAFVNAWPARLVFDDKAFAGPGRAARLDGWQYIFTHDVWSWTGSNMGLYRPLLLLQLSAETRLFGGWSQGYHLSNIFQHLVVTLLLYGFLKYLLHATGKQTPTSTLCALLAALVFAVHPIHTEVVNSVFNRSDMMVATLAISGFWWLLYFLDRHPARAWSGLAVTYFLAMLCKENAVVIPGLAVILILMVKSGDSPGGWPREWIGRLRKCLPVLWLILPLALYLFMRAHALTDLELMPPDLATPETESITQGDEDSTLTELFDQVRLPDFETFLDASAAVGTAFRLVVWPHPLQLVYDNFSPVEWWVYAGLHLVLIGTALTLVVKRRYLFPACLAFFYLALLPSSRIIGTAGSHNAHFADRYAYLPSIGFTILLVFALHAVAQRIPSRTLVRISLPVLLLLTGLTWARNSDWRSDVALFGVEYARGEHRTNTLRWLAGALLTARNYAWVVKICDDNLPQQEKYGATTYTQSCASAYEQQHRFDEAERAHLYAIEHYRTRVAASMSLARFYLRRARPLDAEERFKAAIAWSNDPADKALNTAEMIVALNPHNEQQAIIAKGYIEEALQHRPGWPKAEAMLQSLEKALSSRKSPLIDSQPSPLINPAPQQPSGPIEPPESE